jgi:cell division transport system permease protein
MSFSTSQFLLTQAAIAIRRNPLISIAAVTNVAVALSILGAFVLAAVNLHLMAEQEARRAVITCELTGARSVADVQADLLADRRILRADYLPKDKALQQTAEKWGMDLDALKLLGDILPDSILLYVANPDEIEAVCFQAKKVDGIAQARYPEQVTEKILIVARGVRLAGLAVGILLIVAALTVINTTIRLTIYARRREVRIMQLVGATNGFIRLPFLLEGMFYGLCGGLVSAAALVFGYSSLQQHLASTLDFVRLIYSTPFIAAFAACVVITGIVFGAVGALTGLHRYLRVI